MDGFQQHLETLQGLGAEVIAASAASLDDVREHVTALTYPVAYGVTRAQADGLGSWWEDRRQIIQPSDFVIGAGGKVLSATYSTGPIGRLEPEDAIRFIEFQEKQKQANS